MNTGTVPEFSIMVVKASVAHTRLHARWPWISSSGSAHLLRCVMEDARTRKVFTGRLAPNTVKSGYQWKSRIS